MFRVLISISLLFSSVAFALMPNDDDFDRWEKNWEALIKPGAYDFVPEDISFEEMFAPGFQKKIEEAGKAINPLIEGASTELVGFMVPIDIEKDRVSSFLLVPKAGQCIHVPPPPVNQTIFVDASANPVKPQDVYDPIIVWGTVTIEETQSEVATSGYSMKLERLEVMTIE